MIREFRRKRSRLQTYTFIGLPLVIVGGWIYPKLGFLLLGCMAGAVGIAFYKGRAWCDWMCPRGSFYDLFVGRFSARKKVPLFFKRPAVRIGMITFLFSVLGTLLYSAWPDLDAMGLAMTKVLTMTTLVGIALGLVFQERIWCHICPMGTFSNYLSEGKYPLRIAASCVDCKACERACPMQLKPYVFKGEGTVHDNDCIKCGSCVAACPKKSLAFSPLKKAA